MSKTIRQEIEDIEKIVLAPSACLSVNSKGRVKPEKKCLIRTDFQRDRDRITHCKAFRRLRYKSQVFLAPKGDHYRTRLTHTIELAQISRVIAKALKLNEDLVEAIALGHDLGHTPFGHAGETVLNRLLPNGFRHNEQSLRVVDSLEKNGHGLNLTYEVRDGILKHSKGKGPVNDESKNLPVTLEGQLVRIADLIAYLSHDLDDALRAKILKENEIPRSVTKKIGNSHSLRINAMVSDVIYSTRKNGTKKIEFSDNLLNIVMKLRDFMYKNVYESAVVHAEFIKAENILESLYHYFVANNQVFLKEAGFNNNSKITIQVSDFISGMTDRYVLSLYEKYFLPRPWEIF